MVVNFEFLCDESIENVITCLHYQIDKVVFFGYYDTIVKLKDHTKNFLKKYCGVKEVVFLPLSEKDLPSILDGMRKEIAHEGSGNSQLFFDITGGEGLLLVAFGMLAKELNVPIHMFDIEKDKLIELEEGAPKSISKDVTPQTVELDLDRYVELFGATINYRMQKDIKGDHGQEFKADSEKIFRAAKEYDPYWNSFTNFVTKTMKVSEDLWVDVSDEEVIEEIQKRGGKFNNTGILNEILDVLYEEGVILELEHGSRYRFKFKSPEVKACILETGSPFELHVYHEEKPKHDDCRIGVHIDWDGVVHEVAGEDVFNEIDVLALSGIIPTFISCKSGNLNNQEKLGALYELDTVSRRLGGKYAKKKLVVSREFGDIYEERAGEMGIEVEVAK